MIGLSCAFFVASADTRVFGVGLFRHAQWLPDAKHIAFSQVLLSLASASSYLIFLLTERHSNGVRRFVESFRGPAPK